MIQILYLLKTAINFVFAIIATIIILGGIIFFVLWETGFVKENWPVLYCAMTKTPPEMMVRQTDSTVTVIHYTEGCSCDTTYFKKIELPNATVKRP
jgi:hypothetical protein